MLEQGIDYLFNEVSLYTKEVFNVFELKNDKYEYNKDEFFRFLYYIGIKQEKLITYCHKCKREFPFLVKLQLFEFSQNSRSNERYMDISKESGEFGCSSISMTDGVIYGLQPPYEKIVLLDNKIWYIEYYFTCTNKEKHKYIMMISIELKDGKFIVRKIGQNPSMLTVKGFDFDKYKTFLNKVNAYEDYKKADYKNFIKDIKKYLLDERYIKIDDKPVIMVYNPDAIPDFKELVTKWRKYAREEGIGELYIISKNKFASTDYKYSEFIDASFDFPPHGVGHDAAKITGLSSFRVFNYEKIVDDIGHLYKNHFPLKPFYYTVTMGWDNSARRKEGYTIYYNYSLKSFYKWLRMIIDETRRRNDIDHRFMFVNAWNEWAEGTYLEPDEKYGYANINTLSKAICDLPFDDKKCKKR